MARARGANAVLTGAFETIYGTPPTTGYRKLPFASFNLGEEQGLLDSELLGYGREPLAPSKDVINNEGDVVIPVDLRNVGFWLKALTGAPASVTATGVTTHTFTSTGTSIPSMALHIANPDVPSYGMNFGAVANSMRVQMQRSGLLTATMNLIAQGETPSTSPAAGTATATEAVVERFAQAQGAVSRDGTALGEVVSADFTYSNSLDKVEVLRSDGRIAGADPGMIMMSGSLVLRFAGTTLLDLATAGTSVELSFGWQTDASRSLKVTAHEVFLPRPKRTITGPNGIQATFNWKAAKDPAVGRTMTAVLINDVAGY